MEKYYKQLVKWKKLFSFLMLICFIGFIGRILPYGNEMWNFIFENMIWFPVEAGVTIFIVDRIIQKNNEKLESIREFNQYYALASEDLEEMITSFKIQLISAVTNNQYENEKVDNMFEDICTNIEKYVSVQKLKEGFNAPVFDPSNFLESISNIRYQRISFYQSMPRSSEIILSNIDNHFSLFLKYIPVELFNILHSIQRFLETSVYFSRNENLKLGREMILQRENNMMMQDNEYQQTVDILKEFYSSIYEKINKMESIIESNKKEISQ